jgi:CHAT domain-containing protein
VTATLSPQELCAQALAHLRSDLPMARRLAGQAAWLTRSSPSPEVWRTIAHIHYLSGDYRAALRNYERAARLAREQSDWADLGKTLSGGIQTLAYLGDYGKAEAWAAEARSIFERQEDSLRLARLDSNLANLLLRRDRPAEALALYESALDRLIAAGDRDNAAITLRNLAVCAMSLFDFPRALAAYEKALAFYESRGWPHLTAEVLDNAAYLHYLRGDYSRAIATYQDARRKSDERGNPHYQGVAELDQSDLYLELNLFSEAAAFAARARARFEALGTRYEAAKAATNEAVALSALGRSAEAETRLAAAKELFEKEGNQAWAAVSDLYRVLAAGPDAPGEDAETRITHAERELASLPVKAALANLMLASVRLRRGDLRGGLDACGRAEKYLLDAPNGTVSIAVHATAAQILETQGQRDAAQVRYQAAHRLIRRVRHRLPHDQMKIAFAGGKTAIYEALTVLALEDGRIEEALLISEEAKSRSLADWLSFRSDFGPAHASRGFVEASEVQGLRQELSWRYHEFERFSQEPGATPAKREALLARISETEARLSIALNTLRRVDAAFLELQGVSDAALEQLQATIEPDGALLSYVAARGDLYAFRISRTGLDAAKIGPITPLETSARRLRFHWGSRGSASAAARQHHLEQLAQGMLLPVRHWLPPGKLTVSLPTALTGLPIHALSLDGHPLVERQPVTYTLSATVHSLTHRGRPTAEGALLVGLADALAPEIGAEVSAIGSRFSQAVVLTDEAATRQNFLHHLSGKRWIHIAAHGLFREDNPMFSSVRLADGPLCLFDFYDLNLDAELVTLSGCFTGLGGGVGSGEFIGLTRGLLFAGARAVQAGLWQIDDISTRRYMERFYERLVAGTDVPAAWRASVLELRASQPDPYYWAPFVVME